MVTVFLPRRSPRSQVASKLFTFALFHIFHEKACAFFILKPPLPKGDKMTFKKEQGDDDTDHFGFLYPSLQRNNACFLVYHKPEIACSINIQTFPNSLTTFV